LRGLMVNHDLDPEVYFDYMTREELYDMEPDPGLSSALARLPGRKMVYTNAPGRHAELALTRLGLSDHFEAVYDIQAAGFVPKPAIGAYSELCRLHGIDPAKAVMVDDIITNLEPAAKLGMTTVWMKTSAEWAQDIEVADYVDHVTQDLAGWIDGLLAGG
jgi:putative hydrolase of the HAD superfamily